MELRVSYRRPRMSYQSDPDDKEISDDDDDDDDDRNHKHRRKDDLRYRLSKAEVREHVSTKPYRRGNTPYQNGHLCRETGSQSNETWKMYSFNQLEKEFSVKFNQKGPRLTQFSRGSSYVNLKSRSNLPFSGDPGAVRGRGRGSSQWSPSEPIFSSVDISRRLSTGRGSATVSNSQRQSWSLFGLGGQDVFHPLRLQGTHRPAVNSSLNMGLARKPCRDFEEQGFCLRGDMCPMEHGMNRIVIEDVESLSQFNLPIAPVATSVVTNSKGRPHGKIIKHGIGDIDSAAEFYDPDQPLWSNDSHTSTGLQSLRHPNAVKKDSLMDHGLSNDHRVGQSDGSDNEPVGLSSGTVESLKTRSTVQGVNGRMNCKPSQKAHRTLFVTGIPHHHNKKKLLLSHIQKFGEVTDIIIPLNSERAFVQFSKRKEAEAALVAPDAVMSNRFIKLFWANRDIIHEVSGHNVSIPPHGLKVSSVANKRKDDIYIQSVLHNSKGTKVTPPLQKQLTNLELLKEELRKKQEMLDQKRNDFRRKLDKLEKQATGAKVEVAPEQLAKKQKLGDSDGDAIVPSTKDEVAGTSSTPVGPSGKQCSKSFALTLPKSSSLKPSPLSLVNPGSPVVNNRFKLDNRSTAFKVVSPLPDGLADVPALKEHFSPYGELSKVQVDNVDPKTSNVTAQIYFSTRHAAEKAFLEGKIWKGHNLKFVWLNSTSSRKDDVARQTSSPFLKDSPKTISQQPCTSGDGDSEKTKGMEVVRNYTEPCETHQSNCIGDTE